MDIKENKPGLKDILKAGFKVSDRDKKKAGIIASQNKMVFTNDFSVLNSISQIDVIVEATGYPEAGAEIMLSALLSEKDVVSLNVEADVTIGPVLKKIASERGLVYTISAGDEPAVLKELYDFADALGFKVVCAGKGKNNPLDFYANPISLADYSAKKGSSPKMMTSFVDGTKSMVEMACLSNATGLIPDCRGMHGPKAMIKDLVSVLCLKKDGGILEKEGVVDFVIGDLAPGVFVIYSAENSSIKNTIEYLNLGKGPNYLLYKPYHLTSIETPLSIARTYFERQPWIVPKEGLVSEVFAVAKKDLNPGDIIDGVGGFTVFGTIDIYRTAREQNLLPIGLCTGSVLNKNKKRGEPITYDDVDFPRKTINNATQRIAG